MTIETVPFYWVVETRQLTDWSTAKGLLEQGPSGSILKCHNAEIWLNPYTKKALITRREVTTTSPKDSGNISMSVFMTLIKLLPALKTVFDHLEKIFHNIGDDFIRELGQILAGFLKEFPLLIPAVSVHNVPDEWILMSCTTDWQYRVGQSESPQTKDWEILRHLRYWLDFVWFIKISFFLSSMQVSQTNFPPLAMKYVAIYLVPEFSHVSTREIDIIPDVDIYRRGGLSIRLVRYIIPEGLFKSLSISRLFFNSFYFRDRCQSLDVVQPWSGNVAWKIIPWNFQSFRALQFYQGFRWRRGAFPGKEYRPVPGMTDNSSAYTFSVLDISYCWTGTPPLGPICDAIIHGALVQGAWPWVFRKHLRVQEDCGEVRSRTDHVEWFYESNNLVVSPFLCSKSDVSNCNSAGVLIHRFDKLKGRSVFCDVNTVCTAQAWESTGWVTGRRWI